MFLRFRIIRLLLAVPVGVGLGFLAAPLVTGSPMPESVIASFVRELGFPGAVLIEREPDGQMRTVMFGDPRIDEPFPIASLTKPITAAAIVRLVSEGRLSLDDPVLRLLDLPEPRDARWHRITIRHLLQHMGGWDREIAGDPIDTLAYLGCPEMTKTMLQQPLQHDPGTVAAYSNFGYCLLGLVIERVSGKRYENYIREFFAEPLGLTTLQVGKYEPASMGLVVSPTDLAALLASLDIGLIAASPSPSDSRGLRYGLGWEVWPEDGALSKVGRSPESFGFVLRHRDGRMLLLLCRGRIDNAAALSIALYRKLREL